MLFQPWILREGKAITRPILFSPRANYIVYNETYSIYEETNKMFTKMYNWMMSDLSAKQTQIVMTAIAASLSTIALLMVLNYLNVI
jgi:hypothetical protein